MNLDGLSKITASKFITGHNLDRERYGQEEDQRMKSNERFMEDGRHSIRHSRKNDGFYYSKLKQKHHTNKDDDFGDDNDDDDEDDFNENKLLGNNFQFGQFRKSKPKPGEIVTLVKPNKLKHQSQSNKSKALNYYHSESIPTIRKENHHNQIDKIESKFLEPNQSINQRINISDWIENNSESDRKTSKDLIEKHSQKTSKKIKFNEIDRTLRIAPRKIHSHWFIKSNLGSISSSSQLNDDEKSSFDHNNRHHHHHQDQSQPQWNEIHLSSSNNYQNSLLKPMENPYSKRASSLSNHLLVHSNSKKLKS